MKTVEIQSFTDINDAILWMENHLIDYAVEYEDVKGEITLIDNSWRVGIIVESRQTEIDFG